MSSWSRCWRDDVSDYAPIAAAFRFLHHVSCPTEMCRSQLRKERWSERFPDCEYSFISNYNFISIVPYETIFTVSNAKLGKHLGNPDYIFGYIDS